MGIQTFHRRCSHCGLPAGFFSNMHKDCDDRHGKALSALPALFPKLMRSPVSPDRFAELLLEVARTSYITTAELGRICKDGIEAIVDQLITAGPPAADDVRKLIDLTGCLERAVGYPFANMEQLAKVRSVSEIWEGNILEAISVEGIVPLDLASDELILWIFNHATLAIADGNFELDPISSEDAAPRYFYPTKTKVDDAEVPDIRQTGDLALTSRAIHFLSRDGPHLSCEVSDVSAIKNFGEVMISQISTRRSNPLQQLWIVTIDDPWFAVNMISALRHANAG